jgi:hypothetical protein
VKKFSARERATRAVGGELDARRSTDAALDPGAREDRASIENAIEIGISALPKKRSAHAPRASVATSEARHRPRATFRTRPYGAAAHTQIVKRIRCF